jgi:limonene-1,2-epoxide hydrolase
MATYAELADCSDPVVVVEEGDLEAADRMIAAVLRNKGIDPVGVVDVDGLALLKDLAVSEAIRLAATRGAADGETVLWRKVDEYRRRAQELAMRVDRESLGLAASGSGSAGYASIPVGRA